MIWPKNWLMEAAPSGDGEGGSGESKKDDKSTKIKLGNAEYEPADLESAVSLFNALKDPDTGMEIVETLARRAGLLDKKGDVKENLSEKQKESISKGILKKALGKDYEQFADKVGPAFDEIIEEYLGQKLGDMESRNTQTTWEGHVEKFLEDHTMTKEIENTMKELMEDAPPAINRKGFDAKKYLRRMYNNAITELDIETPAPKSGKSKGKGKDDELGDIVFRDAPKNVSVDDAIDAALKGIRFVRK